MMESQQFYKKGKCYSTSSMSYKEGLNGIPANSSYLIILTPQKGMILALVQFRTRPKPDGIKHTVAHTIVLCMHQQRFIPSVIGPVRNCTSAMIFTMIPILGKIRL